MVHSLSGVESGARGAKSVCPVSRLNRIGGLALWRALEEGKGVAAK